MVHRVQASIDLSALQHNFRVARKHTNAARVAAIIKANAYGHGLAQAATALSASADLFGVTDINEAETLAQVGTGKPILILQGIMSPDDLPRIAQQNFQLVVHTSEQLALLDDTFSGMTLPAPLTLWLKMESGMGRLGLSSTDYADTCRALMARPWCQEVVMMTHLANSSLPDSPLNQQQLQGFRAVEAQLAEDAPATSIPSSAGILSGLPVDCTIARPGIMLYGSSPFDWHASQWRREAFNLKAVMTLQAQIIAVKNMQAGDNIGYNSQFICEQDTRVGIVSIGYADGYPSNAPNGTPVMVAGKRTRTLGRVSMDMLAVDLTDIAEAGTGDLATLWGKELSLDEVAAKTGILSYNLTCSVAKRVTFTYL